MHQMHKSGKICQFLQKYVLKNAKSQVIVILEANWRQFTVHTSLMISRDIFKKKCDIDILVGRFSSISIDLSSIFSTTYKTCKEMVKEKKYSYKCWHFQAQMSRLCFLCCENVENRIYALWWAGLTQIVNGGQVRWFWGRGSGVLCVSSY